MSVGQAAQLIFKKSFSVKNLPKILEAGKVKLPQGLKISEKAVSVDVVKVRAKNFINEWSTHRVYSLKDKDGKLVQSLHADYTPEINKMFEYNYNKTYFSVKPASEGKKAIHNYRYTTKFNHGKPIFYEETDVSKVGAFYYVRKPNDSYYKISHEIQLGGEPNIHEKTSIRILSCEGKKEPFKGKYLVDTYNYGFEHNNLRNNLTSATWLNLRCSTKPEILAHSVINAKGYGKKVQLKFLNAKSSFYGSSNMQDGVHVIIINRNLPLKEVVETVEHEIKHAEQIDEMLEYLAKLVKGKSDFEIEQYVKMHDIKTDPVAHLYEIYLTESWMSKSMVRKLGGDVKDEKHTLDLVKNHMNYISGAEKFSEYIRQKLEQEALNAEGRLAKEMKHYESTKEINLPYIFNNLW